jgi:hypothetical protein
MKTKQIEQLGFTKKIGSRKVPDGLYKFKDKGRIAILMVYENKRKETFKANPFLRYTYYASLLLKEYGLSQRTIFEGLHVDSFEELESVMKKFAICIYIFEGINEK